MPISILRSVALHVFWILYYFSPHNSPSVRSTQCSIHVGRAMMSGLVLANHANDSDSHDPSCSVFFAMMILGYHALLF
jgi:hypothetical protein